MFFFKSASLGTLARGALSAGALSAIPIGAYLINRQRLYEKDPNVPDDLKLFKNLKGRAVDTDACKGNGADGG